jgi:SAM-dependent methyltransferase
MNTHKEVAFFDDFAGSHGDYNVLGEGAYRRLLDTFDKMVQPKPAQICLDLGCGTGAFTRRLSKFGLDLTGIDISPRSIEAARRQSTRETYAVGDIRRSQFADASVDIVVFSGVLHHCPTRELRVEILREARRILKRGGRVWAYDPSAHSPSMWLYRHPSSPLYSAAGKTDNEVLLTRHDLRAELAEAGFGDIEVRGIGGITYRYVEGTVAKLMLPLYNLYEHALRVSPLENRWGTFLISFARS